MCPGTFTLTDGTPSLPDSTPHPISTVTHRPCRRPPRLARRLTAPQGKSWIAATVLRAHVYAQSTGMRLFTLYPCAAGAAVCPAVSRVGCLAAQLARGAPDPAWSPGLSGMCQDWPAPRRPLGRARQTRARDTTWRLGKERSSAPSSGSSTREGRHWLKLGAASCGATSWIDVTVDDVRTLCSQMRSAYVACAFSIFRHSQVRTALLFAACRRAQWRPRACRVCWNTSAKAGPRVKPNS